VLSALNFSNATSERLQSKTYPSDTIIRIFILELYLIMNHDFLAQKTPLLLTSLWVGAASYVAYISHKGRQRLDEADKLKSWTDEFKPALKSMGGLAALSSAAGFYSYYATKNLNYVYGAATMALCFPYTYIFLRPLYTDLLKADQENAPSDRTGLGIQSWVNAHKGRVVLGIVAALLFLFAESSGGTQKI
jgi:hypothetical protein